MARTEQPSAPLLRPEVIVDFSVQGGALSVHLKNVGARPAYAVKTVFDKPFTGLGGEKPISALRIFQRLELLAPGRELTQLVDTASGYVRRKQPLRIKATVSYRDREGTRYVDEIVHDLRAYFELGEARAVTSGENHAP